MAVTFGAAGLETEGNAAEAKPWPETKGRRVIREYPTAQQMLDDIWQAHQHGWLPLSMTEETRSERRWTAPRTWFDREVGYVVAYRNNAH